MLPAEGKPFVAQNWSGSLGEPLPQLYPNLLTHNHTLLRSAEQPISGQPALHSITWSAREPAN